MDLLDTDFKSAVLDILSKGKHGQKLKEMREIIYEQNKKFPGEMGYKNDTLNIFFKNGLVMKKKG